MKKHRRGFTLIELLIVIAIILILIAIALPNFLEAQLRAKVVRTKADMRTVGIAMDSYYLDFDQYPPDHDPDVNNLDENGLYQLTSPIAYISALPEDQFSTASGLGNSSEILEYETATTGHSPQLAHFLGPVLNINSYVITSHGPDVGDNFSCNNDWPFCSLNPCPGDGWIEYVKLGLWNDFKSQA